MKKSDRDLLKEIEGLEIGIKRKDAEIVVLKEWHTCEINRAENKQTIIDLKDKIIIGKDKKINEQREEVKNAIGLVKRLQIIIDDLSD